MKVFFDRNNLIVKSENYTENIALETWSENFFKRMDMNIDINNGYYLLLVNYKEDDVEEYKHDPSKA